MDIKKFFSASYGTSTVEFALLSPFFFFFLFMVVNLGILYWTVSTMEYAVEAGGRYVMINSTATSSQVIAQAQANLYAINAGSITFTTSNVTSGSINYMVIKAQTTFNIVPGAIFPVTSINLSKQVQVPLF